MKYKSVRIGEMDAELFSANASSLLIKISVITGWQIPGGKENEVYTTVLLDQFKKKMVDSYQDLNTDEFEYAMREYAIQIKDWGKAMNLSLIDSAIEVYLQKRRVLSELEERLRRQQTEIAKQQAQIAPENNWADNCEYFLQRAKDGTIDTAIIPVPVYEWLVDNGYLKLTIEEKITAIEDARIEMLHKLSVDYELLNLDSHQIDIYKELKSGAETLNLSKDLLIDLKNNARRECARAYFKKIANEITTK